MTFTDETLSAFIDGELTDAEMARIADTLVDDPVLAARLQDLRAADSWTVDQFGAIEEVPLRAETTDLLDTLASELAKAGETGNVTPFPAARQSSRWMPSAVAASLALAIGFGAGTLVPSAEPSTSTAKPALTAEIGPSHPYFAALETTPSMADSLVAAGEQQTLTPLASFRNTEGQYCREFSLRAEARASFNLACKGEDSWTVVASVMTDTAPAQGADAYVPASGNGTSLIDELIRDQMEGDLLSPEAEAALIDSAWDH